MCTHMQNVTMWGDAYVHQLDCGIISQCLHISKHHIFAIFVNHTSIKLEK